jgi:hypothetical protein
MKGKIKKDVDTRVQRGLERPVFVAVVCDSAVNFIALLSFYLYFSPPRRIQ